MEDSKRPERLTETIRDNIWNNGSPLLRLLFLRERDREDEILALLEVDTLLAENGGSCNDVLLGYNPGRSTSGMHGQERGSDADCG